jgi:replicative DNA helicase Mcm
MLKYVSKLAPRGIYTSGKGTSGVGLTAAAVRDEFGGWSLEAGALVLGDKGNVCVDELDKNATRRSFSHPRSTGTADHKHSQSRNYGHFKFTVLLCWQLLTLNLDVSIVINLSQSKLTFLQTILSRFDLIFVVEDKPDTEKDSALASHILNIHQDTSIPYEIDPELSGNISLMLAGRTSPPH